jgi:hypothetical protein
MTHDEYATYHNDYVKANRLFKAQMKGKRLDIDLAAIFRNINKAKFDSDMYDIPYVSVFER